MNQRLEELASLAGLAAWSSQARRVARALDQGLSLPDPEDRHELLLENFSRLLAQDLLAYLSDSDPEVLRQIREYFSD